MYAGATTIAEEDRQNVYKALEFLNIFLEGNKYVIGSDEPTLADVVIFVSVTNVVVCDLKTLSAYISINAYFTVGARWRLEQISKRSQLV